MNTNYVLPILLTLGIFSTVNAKDAPVTFDQLDDDKNGYLSQSEASQRQDLKEKWAMADKDADGKLDISEFSAFEVRMVPPDDMESPEIGAAPTK